LGADHGGAEVERVATALGDPAVVDLQELADQLGELLVLKALFCFDSKKKKKWGQRRRRGCILETTSMKIIPTVTQVSD
jgi:hypothetical protein